MSKCSFNFSSLHSINSFKDVYTVPITQEKIQMSHKSSLSTKMPAQTYLKFLKLFHGMEIMQAPFINVNFAIGMLHLYRTTSSKFISLSSSVVCFFFQFIHMKWVNIFFVKCPSWCFAWSVCSQNWRDLYLGSAHVLGLARESTESI